MFGILALTAAVCACEGNITVGEMPNPPQKPAPGPIMDRMPTADDCASGEAVFTNDAPARLLTRYEYDNTVRDLLGVEAGLAREVFPPENATGGFENSIGSHVVSPLLVRKYLEVSEELGQLAVAQNEYGDGFLAGLVYRAFRRPPTTEELAAFETLLESATTQWGATRGREMVVSAVLQSPQFLYRLEPADQRAPGEVVQNGPFEMATRLSYLVWATMPDEALFAAAEADELRTAEQVEAQVRRMLADPRAEAMVGHFYRQWLELDRFDALVKDAATFPGATDVADDWRASIDAYVRWAHFESDGTLETLMTSDKVFVTPDLAALYGVDGGAGLEAVAMGEERAGLLTQPALLALLAYPAQGSPIHRGIFVRENLLCQALAPPPADQLIAPPDPDPNATTRERFAEHTANPDCAGCHELIDPLGFGFETYDGVGRYRTEEAGISIDASGELVASGDSALDGPFDGAVELAQRLATSEVLANCVADQWTTFALGQRPTLADLCSQKSIRAAFVEAGSFEDLFVSIATSDAMRYRVVQRVEP